MRDRKLGRTGYRVSEIGFGGWGIGGTMWRGVPDAEGKRALETALDLGVNFLDTALAYGDGHSERLIGEVLREKGLRYEAVVATKIPPMDYQWPASPAKPIREVFPARWVRESVETSLRNLDVEALNLEQFHVWTDAWLSDPAWEGTRETMDRLKEEGKVLHWGVSVNDHAPETALGLLRDGAVEAVQVIYNVFDRSPERELLPLAKEHDLGVIVRVPFDEGILAGAITPDTVFPEGDWRQRYFRGERKAEAWKRAEALKPLLGSEAATLPELALRFVLSRPEVSAVIPGMRRTEHARANVAVSDGRTLSDGLLRRLEAHAWDKNWYGA